MKDELVTLETAKLAKEKGFDLPVRSYYRHDGIISYWEYAENANSSVLTKTLYSRPTQSLLQGWLRSKGIIVFVELFDYGWFEKDKPAYQFRIYNGSETEQSVSSNEYKEYELALETALQEGLKLIP